MSDSPLSRVTSHAIIRLVDACYCCAQLNGGAKAQLLGERQPELPHAADDFWGP